MALERGCIFIEQCRPVSFSPDTVQAYASGALRAAGVPARRARIQVDHADWSSQSRALPAQVRERLIDFLRERPLSHVFLVSQFFPETDALIRETLPGVELRTLGEKDSPRSIVAIFDGDSGRDEAPEADPSVPHWARHGETPTSVYESIHKARIRPDYEVAELSVATASGGIDGTIFIDHPCYYRGNYRGSERALEGSSSCTFCAVPQPLRRDFPPDLDVVDDQLLGQLEQRPDARTFLVIDANILAHIGEFAERVSRAPVRGLEFCSAIRVPHILRYRENLESALEIFRRAGHRYHLYNIGFESFVESDWQRFSKGYPLVQNLECIEVLDDIEQRFPDSFGFRRWAAHGFIANTPWTSLDELRTTLFFGQALRFWELTSEFYLRRLRLYPYLPLYKLAAADGLLVEQYDDWRHDTAWRTGYEQEVPWRSRDPRVDAVHAWALRLIVPSADREHRWRARLDPIVVDQLQTDPGLRIFAAILGAVEDGVDHRDEEAFVDAVATRCGWSIHDLFTHPSAPRASLVPDEAPSSAFDEFPLEGGPDVVLSLSPGRAIGLFDVQDAHDGWHYGRVDATGDDTALDDVASRIREGERVRWTPRLLYIYRDGRLIDVVPHASFVPVRRDRPPLVRSRDELSLIAAPTASSSHGGEAGPREEAPEHDTTEVEVLDERVDAARRILELWARNELSHDCPDWSFDGVERDDHGWSVGARGPHAAVTVVLGRDDGERAFLRGGGLSVSYRADEGAEYDASVGDLCRSTLMAAARSKTVRSIIRLV